MYVIVVGKKILPFDTQHAMLNQELRTWYYYPNDIWIVLSMAFIQHWKYFIIGIHEPLFQSNLLKPFQHLDTSITWSTHCKSFIDIKRINNIREGMIVIKGIVARHQPVFWPGADDSIHQPVDVVPLRVLIYQAREPNSRSSSLPRKRLGWRWIPAVAFNLIGDYVEVLMAFLMMMMMMMMMYLYINKYF